MDALSRLVDALRALPGVGPKSAQRMAYQLLQQPRQRGMQLAACLDDAMRHVKHCRRCNNYSSMELCGLCSSSSRDRRLLCVVEGPSDVVAIEQSHVYQGCYYVLMGKLSPLDGIGPEHIGLPRLLDLVKNEGVSEVILALSPTIEGQTTGCFIQSLLSSLVVKLSQLAHGIPAGGELEFLDANTIGHALRNRSAILQESQNK